MGKDSQVAAVAQKQKASRPPHLALAVFSTR